MAPDEMTPRGLQYLNCPRCAAPTPLVGNSHAECAYCAAKIEVPAPIGEPIRRFHAGIAELKQHAFERDGDPAEHLSSALVALMGLAIAFFLVWWWRTYIDSWASLDPPAIILLADLVAMPIGLMFLSVLFAGGELDYFRRSKLEFANLRFDVGSLMKDALGCPRCAASLDYKETRDIIVSCHHCRGELLIPALLLSDQLQSALSKVMAMRNTRYNRYEVRKWVLIVLTAANGVGPILVMQYSSLVATAHLLYLTGFSWSYLINVLCAAWARHTLNAANAALVFVLLSPLPIFFLFQMSRELLGLDTTRW